MTTVNLPNSANPTTSLGFGCAYVMGSLEEPNHRRVLDAAYDAGLRHFDVSPSYGMGMAEDVLGRAMRGRRDRVTIASKVGIARPNVGPLVRMARTLASPLRKFSPALTRALGIRMVGGAAERGQFDVAFVERSLSESLRRLNTDYLDVLLLHEVRPSDITDELLAMLDRNRRSGIVRAVGVASLYSTVVSLAASHGAFFDVLQYSWSALDVDRPRPHGARFSITHQALLRAYTPIQRWLAQDPSARIRLSEELGLELASNSDLGDLLLAAALSRNPDGIVLAATRQEARARRLGAVLADGKLRECGRKLVEALAREALRPSPNNAS